MKKLILTLLLQFIMAGSALAALAIDGVATGNSSTSTATVTLTTTSTNDVIVVQTVNNSASSVTVTGVTDTAGLTWTKRAGVDWDTSGRFRAEEWYAIAPTALSNDTITVSYSSAASHSIRNFAFGVSGANTTTPFDTNGSLPATAQFVDATKNISATISTTNPNSILIGLVGTFGGIGTVTYPSGFSLIVAGGTLSNSSKSIVSSQQSGVAEQWSWTGASSSRVLILDAIQAPGGAPAVSSLLNTGY
jgi:hypothetical protein